MNVYENIQFIDRNDIVEFDEKIILKLCFNKSIQGGYAEQLGFENPPYIRPVVSIPELLRPIKNKYIALVFIQLVRLKYWNHPNGIKSQGDPTNWNELSSILRKRGYTPVTVEKDELFGVPPFYNGIPSKSNKKLVKLF
jgi:hypothetical protein